MKNCAVGNNFKGIGGEIRKEINLSFFYGPEDNNCGRAGQLAAAGAAANCYASIRCSIPRRSRSASGAGGGRPADAAKEVYFPAVRAASSVPARSAGACGFSRIGCSIPSRSAEPGAARALAGRAKEGLIPVPGSSKFYGFGYEALDKGVATINDGEIRNWPYIIHRGIESAVPVNIQIRGLIWRNFGVKNFERKSMFPVREFPGRHFAFPSYSGFAGKICYIRKFCIRILRARRIFNYFFIPNISGSVFYSDYATLGRKCFVQ